MVAFRQQDFLLVSFFCLVFTCALQELCYFHTIENITKSKPSLKPFGRWLWCLDLLNPQGKLHQTLKPQDPCLFRTEWAKQIPEAPQGKVSWVYSLVPKNTPHAAPHRIVSIRLCQLWGREGHPGMLRSGPLCGHTVTKGSHGPASPVVFKVTPS